MNQSKQEVLAADAGTGKMSVSYAGDSNWLRKRCKIM